MGRTVFFYLTFYPWTILSAIIALTISLFSRTSARAYVSFWAKCVVKIGGVKIIINGEENIPTNQPAIYVSNHQSNFDVPVIYASLPIHFGWLAKQELFQVPLFGAAMKKVDCVPIDRSNRRKMMSSINAAAKRIKNGTSVVIFPEGTRSPDGNLQPFKKGALLIAAKAQVPVVPIAIYGSYELLPKDRWTVTAGTVIVNFLPSLTTDDLKGNDLELLTQTAHDQIATSLQGAMSNGGK